MTDFRVVSAGPSWFDDNVPCTRACPVLTNAGRYVSAIAAGDDLDAYLTARMPNPFASICGRVCAAPCESACRRQVLDEPIAIRALKRHATEQHGVESSDGDRYWRQAVADRPVRDERVAVVGAGPAGLACAHDLAAYGYRPVVIDAADRPGGMMVLGIPPYRLRRDLLDAEIRAILDLGVDLRLSTRLGEDVSLASLREEFAAVFVAVGAMRSRELQIPGVELDGVLRAVEFLLNVNQGFQVDLGERVLVVGGGNVALDTARTALREVTSSGSIPSSVADPLENGVEAATSTTFDAARTALRMGAREVLVVALESRDEMPASEFEIHEAELEGIHFAHRRGPKAILGDERVRALETLDVVSVFDSDGRFNPQFLEGSEAVIECDSVILAVGQACDLSWLDPEDGVESTSRGTVAVDRETLATSAPGVFAGGDVAFGPRNLIDAIADGRRAAASIHRMLAGEEEPFEVAPDEVDRARPGAEAHRPVPTWDARSRVEVPAVPSGRRIGAPEIELGYTREQARIEGARCLQCFLNITLEAERCILCAGCVDICPMGCLRIIPTEELDGVEAEQTGSGLIIDEDLCIRCGLCIERCPTDALFFSKWAESSTAVGLPTRISPDTGPSR